MVFENANLGNAEDGEEELGLLGSIDQWSEEALARTFYFPADLIGGSCPQVKGEEELVAWNAAAEACDSERIHFVWRVHEGRVWYLAVRSADLASSPHSWCPFASLLPGMAEAKLPPVIYVYYSDEAAIMMVVTVDSLQIIRGTTSIIRAKAERIARDMGGAEIVSLIPDSIVKLKAVSWESLSLMENRARRFYAFASIMSALAITIVSFLVWFMASLAQLTYDSNLKELSLRTNNTVMQLQMAAMDLRTSSLREQMASFNQLNENLVGVEGWLKRYYVEGNQVKWWAVVPANLTADRIQDLKAQMIESSDAGTIIANSKDAVVSKSQR